MSNECIKKIKGLSEKLTKHLKEKGIQKFMYYYMLYCFLL